MKKIFFILLFLFLTNNQLNSDSKINSIIEGSVDAKVKLIVYESLTCIHCATFHENIYPNLNVKVFKSLTLFSLIE